MRRQIPLPLSLLSGVAALVAALTLAPVSASPRLSVSLAIRGARVFTAAGAPIDNATVVVRDGVIAQVGAGVTAPPDAVVIDGSGMNVYPGLVDMANDAPIDDGADAAPAGARGGGGGGRGGGTPAFATLEEAERAKRQNLLRPDFMAAEHLRTSSPELSQLAAAGITSVLAVPSSGIFKGQSALVNVALAPDDPQISTIANYRRGLAVVKSPVAMHINMAGRGGGQGYPNSLLGSIAFMRQGLLDAQWQRDAMAQYEKAGARGPRPVIEPPLNALQPMLTRQMPAAFDAMEAREIDRVLAIAAEFNLDPIVVGARMADQRAAELASAKARVIFSLDFPGGRGGGAGGGGGGRGGGGAPSLRVLKEQAAMPKAPAVLAQAGVQFAFTSGTLTPADFVRNVARVIKEGGLPADRVLRALTIDAARLAGAADRLGTIEPGKIANLVVTQGDLFEGGTIRHVIIDGHPVNLDVPAAPTGRGRGGNSRRP